MNRIVFSGGFFAGSFWGAGVYVLLSKGKKDTESSTEEKPKTEKVEHILKYGPPTRSSDISFYNNHLLCYDQERKIPRWVAEDITADHITGDANRKHCKFHPDPSVPEKFRTVNADFLKSGWSRGHMAPAGDYKFDQASMKDTFLLSNILPQDFKNNGGFWNRFEMYCRELTKTYGHVRVISGPAMVPNVEEEGKHFVKYQVIGKTQVAVPTHLYKVIVAEDDPEEKQPVLGSFLVPNEPIGFNRKLEEYKIPLDDLEKKTGLIFLPKLDRTKTRDLCTVDGCQLIERAKFELYFIGRRLSSAETLEKLEKAWREIETKGLEPDDYAKNLYAKKKTEILKKIDAFKYN